MKKAKGFTLVELLVVIAIIGILAVVVFPLMASKIKTAKDGKAYAAMSAMRSVLSAGIGELNGNPPAASYSNMQAIVNGGTLVSNSSDLLQASVSGVDDKTRQLISISSGTSTGYIECGIFKSTTGTFIRAPFTYQVNNSGSNYEDGQLEFSSGTNSFNQNWDKY